jgi:hypothetical protein
LQLADHLCRLAEIWAESNNRSEATLGSKVAGDSKLFDRLRTGSSCTISTFEKLLAFFRGEENWLNGNIPDSAVHVLARLDNISTDTSASSGKSCEIAA